MNPDPKTIDDLAGLTDDQIMSMEAPPSGGVLLDNDVAVGADTSEPVEDTSASLAQVPAVEVASDVEETDPNNADVLGKSDASDDAGNTKGAANGEGDDKNKPVDTPAVDASGKPVEALGEDGKPLPGATTSEQKAPGEADGAVVPETPDYKAAYEMILAPFKANGKEIQVRSPEEALRLMQMGANYTVKLQELQPQKRIIKLLENHGLLDEGKLSFLVDLDKKNPQAIAKLVKDSGINLMDLDTEGTTYQAPNHAVSDAEINFSSTLETVMAEDHGAELVSDIAKWDSSSKQALGQDPSILNLLSDQKADGTYDKVIAEVERQRILDPRFAQVPIINAYVQVGNAMKAQGLLGPANPTPKVTEQPAAAVVPPVPLATRTATPQEPANASKVKAASPARSAPTAVKTEKDFLAMSDEDFAKETAGRL